MKLQKATPKRRPSLPQVEGGPCEKPADPRTDDAAGNLRREEDDHERFAIGQWATGHHRSTVIRMICENLAPVEASARMSLHSPECRPVFKSWLSRSRDGNGGPQYVPRGGESTEAALEQTIVTLFGLCYAAVQRARALELHYARCEQMLKLGWDYQGERPSIPDVVAPSHDDLKALVHECLTAVNEAWGIPHRGGVSTIIASLTGASKKAIESYARSFKP